MFARDHGLIWIDECSALAGINIDETFMLLAEEIKKAQMSLVEQGVIPLSNLKIKEADTAQHY